MIIKKLSWNNILEQLPCAHILQTEEWSKVKYQTGWKASEKLWLDEHNHPTAAALLLQRSLPVIGFSSRLRILYVPKGPILNWQNPVLRSNVLDDLTIMAKQRGAIFIKIDPDVRLGTGVVGEPNAEEDNVGQEVVAELRLRGWHYSQDQIQFKNTVLLDLQPDEATLLSQMKQKTRYNIRLAQRRGVNIRQGALADLELLFHMYAETSVRDGFVLRDKNYYYSTWSTFLNAGLAKVWIAQIEGIPIGAIIVLHFKDRAWYMYGMSRDIHRDKMPNYLLQWEAIRLLKSIGIRWYDLWGAPDQFNEQDPLWGVYRFKEGLGGKVIRHIGAWDFPVKPVLYNLYTEYLPKFLSILRNRGIEQTRQLIRG